ncbi:MAG: hypothetical protein WD673_00985 [Alphaproteobacteria bacterium]
MEQLYRVGGSRVAMPHDRMLLHIPRRDYAKPTGAATIWLRGGRAAGNNPAP